MTQLSTFGGVVVPSPTEAATIPADFLRLANQLCGTANSPARVNAVVSSKAERDGNYAGYPAGGIVVCPQAKTIWMSLGMSGSTQAWQTIYVDTGWITDGFSFGPNFTPYATGTVKARRKGPQNFLRVQVTYNGDTTITADGTSATWPSNITDQVVLTGLPADFIPPDEQSTMFFATYTNGAARLQVDGAVKLLSMNTASKIAPAHAIQMQFTWPADD